MEHMNARTTKTDLGPPEAIDANWRGPPPAADPRGTGTENVRPANGPGAEEIPGFRGMTRRLWIGAALTLPIYALSMIHSVPSLQGSPWTTSEASRWIRFLLATPVVCWLGWPFFERAWRSVATLRPDMSTLIGLGVGASYLYSAAAMVAPDLFPDAMRHDGKVGLYFSSAAVVVVLALLGEIVESRARNRMGTATQALLKLDEH